MFKSNLGTIDKILRVALGIGLLVWFFVDQSTGLGHYAKLIGILPLLTAVMGSCPLYSIFGFNTCGLKR
jgi:Protein of unknown function (DUF2892)